MLAKDVRAGKKSCLSKAADDEPVFILRARDILAPQIVETWAGMLDDVADPKDDAATEKMLAKIKGARALAHQMRAWQELNGSKLPD